MKLILIFTLLFAKNICCMDAMHASSQDQKVKIMVGLWSSKETKDEFFRRLVQPENRSCAEKITLYSSSPHIFGTEVLPIFWPMPQDHSKK